MIQLDLTGFAERYAKDPDAVKKFAAEQRVSIVTVYNNLRRAGFVCFRGHYVGREDPYEITKIPPEDEAYIRKHYETRMSATFIATHIGCHISTLRKIALRLGLRRPWRGRGARSTRSGPKVRTSAAAPVVVRFANVIHWMRREGHAIKRDIKPGLWVIGEDDIPFTPRAVVLWANDKRTRHVPEALPLFDCNFDGLEGA